MSEKMDDYDVFLANWVPSPLLHHATLDSNLFDPLAQWRLQSDSTATGEVHRTANIRGKKHITETEREVRKFEFFKRTQASESKEFEERLLDAGVEPWKVDAFIRAMAQDWVDGRRRRQHAPIMERIKASIQHHDRIIHQKSAGKFVINHVPDHVEPLFDVSEMRHVFNVNEDMIARYMDDYLAAFPLNIGSSINHIYVRRGVAMPKAPRPFREELYYLSSFSLALTPAEQFAQTVVQQSGGGEIQCVFSAPVPALQQRVVAFAPFIAGMDIGQLELVVAPPIEEVPLHDAGEYGGIRDYEFA